RELMLMRLMLGAQPTKLLVELGQALDDGFAIGHAPSFRLSKQNGQRPHGPLAMSRIRLGFSLSRTRPPVDARGVACRAQPPCSRPLRAMSSGRGPDASWGPGGRAVTTTARRLPRATGHCLPVGRGERPWP